MIIKVIRERTRDSGAVPSKVFVDGVFFSYGLENADYMIPYGTYDLYGKYSPSFRANKVYIDVPGRSNILFHGGNTADQTKGCIILGAKREGDKVSKDQSSYLFDVVSSCATNNEPVALVIQKDRTAIYAAICFLGLMFLYFKR